MNANDSDWLSRSLQHIGFIEVPFEKASFYILNTCSVRDKPEQKVYSELGRIARFCAVHSRKNITVCVGGCVAQQAGPKLARRFPQVRLLFGTDGIAHAPEAISRLAEESDLRLNLLAFAEQYEERSDVRLTQRDLGIAAQQAKGWTQPIPPVVSINIMRGCDNFCTYCIVPYVRGRLKSRHPENVLNECRALLAGGAREITLLGQNVNAYGQDSNGDGTSFAQLLTRVSALQGLERLRFVTSHPKDIAPEIIDAFARLDVICPRLHLPLQSGSDRILTAMNRRYDAGHYLDIVQRLKAARPDIALSTDIIVGFPGETEEDFQATMRMMETVGFCSSFSFVYSDRPHTKAALLPGKVERSIALDRLSRLQQWQGHASGEILCSLTGQQTTILLEGKNRRDTAFRNGQTPPLTKAMEAWQGKTPQGFTVNVYLPPKPNADFCHGGWAGAMLPVVIETTARHSLKGRQASAPW